jgi:tape measure domain-containing protein
MQGAPRIKRGLDNVKNSANATRKALALMRNLLVVVAAARVIKRFVDLADSFTVMQNRLKLVTTGLTNLIEVQDKLFAVSQETGSSIESNISLFARMSRATERLGVSQNNLIDITRGINQALVLSGATAQEARNGLIQFSQGLAAGALRGDELRSVVEQFPELATVIAKEFGIAGGELASFAKNNEGALTTERIIKAINAALPDLNKRFKETNDTVGRALERINNSLIRFLGELGQSTGILNKVIQLLNFVANNLDKIAKGAIIVGAVLIQIFTGVISKAILFFIASIKTAGVVVFTFGKGLFSLTAIVTGLKTAVIGLGVAFAAVATVGIAAALAALVVFKDEIILLENAGATLGDGFGVVFDEIKVLGEEIFLIFKDIASAFSDAFDNKTAMGVFREFLLFTLEGVLRLVKIFQATASGIRNIIALASFDFKRAAELNALSLKQFGEALGGESLIRERLEQRAQERIANAEELGADVPGGQARRIITITPKVKLDKKELSALDSLRKSLFPVAQANKELADSINLLDKAFKTGDISRAEYELGIERLNETSREARLPLVEFEKALQEELKVSKLGTDARKIAIAQRELEILLKEKDETITQAEIKLAQERLAVTLKQIEANEKQVKLFEDLRSTQKDFNDALATFNDDVAAAPDLVDKLTERLTRLRIEALKDTGSLADGLKASFLELSLDFNRRAEDIGNTFTSIFKKMEDSIVEFVETGKFNLNDFFSFIRKELIKLAVRDAITGPLAKVLGGAAGGATGGGGSGILGGLFGGGGGIQGTGEFDGGGGGGGFLSTLFSGFSFSPTLFGAKGGAMEVRGAGGTDSQSLRLMTTPGETVAVFTPQQLKALNDAVGVDDSLKAVFRGAGLESRFAQEKEVPLEDVIRASVNGDRRLPGFQNGGKFTIGGTGGADSQLVKFMGTPGEEVEIRKKGDKQDGREDKVRPIQVNFNFAPGTDADSFRASQGQIGAAFSAALSRHSRRNN